MIHSIASCVVFIPSSVCLLALLAGHFQEKRRGNHLIRKHFTPGGEEEGDVVTAGQLMLDTPFISTLSGSKVLVWPDKTD